MKPRAMAVIAMMLAAAGAHAQSTMTYQGRLDNAGMPANGTFEFEFRLFDDAAIGPPDTQIGPVLSFTGASALPVTNGLVTANLDFGNASYNGQPRFLEVRVRPLGGGAYTTLSPRQNLASAPSSYNLALPLQEYGTSTSFGTGAFWIANNGAQGGGVQGDGPTFGVLGDAGNVTGYPGLPTPCGVAGIGATIGVGGTSASGYGVWGASTTGVSGFFDVLPTSIDTATALQARVRGPNGGNAGLFEILDAANAHEAIRAHSASTAANYATIRGVLDPVGPGIDSAGVRGDCNAVTTEGAGVWGTHAGSGAGVFGTAPTGFGVYGTATATSGLNVGVRGDTLSSAGYGGYFRAATLSSTTAGLYGSTASTAANAMGIQGVVESTSPGGFSTAVRGQNNGTGGSGIGVWGSQAGGGWGVYGTSVSGIGVFGSATGSSGANFGVYGQSNSTTGYAGYFVGQVNVSGDLHIGGTLTKAGGSFKIDHPLDPENKYLSHSFVESPDMKNVYDGVVTTNDDGLATVTLPDWFEALNEDYRYQLTVIGGGEGFPQVRVQTKIKNGRFVVKSSQPNIEVSWQVTGIRKDAWAEHNRIPVEEMKSEADRGKYLNPEAFGAGPDKRIGPGGPTH